MKKILGIATGIILVACGIVYSLDILGICEISVSFDGWWTLFIIVPSLCGLFDKKSDKTTSFFGLCVGILLLLAARGVLEYSVACKLIIPILLVMIGIKMVIKFTFGKKKFEQKSKEYKDGDENAQNSIKIGAFFGGTKTVLDRAQIEQHGNVNLACVFGGATLYVPKDVNVKINSFSLFGGISDKRDNCECENDAPTLIINGFCLFGGADIKSQIKNIKGEIV